MAAQAAAVGAIATRERTGSRDERTPNRKPTNPLVTPLLTDFYQISMAYTYWKQGRHEKPAVFESRRGGVPVCV